MRVIRSVDSTAAENERADDQFGTLGGGNNIFAAGDCCCLEWPKRESDHWFQVRLWRQARAMGSYAAKCMTDSVDELGSGGAFDLFVHATQFFGLKVRVTQVSKIERKNPQGHIIDAAHKILVTNVAITLDLNSSSSVQVALLGHFNGQGLGPSIQDFVSSHVFEVDVNTSGAENGAFARPRCHHESIRIKNGSTNVQVLIRTTPAVEYIKAGNYCICWLSYAL